MNRIKRQHSGKDRIICVNAPGKLRFFYQPVGMAAGERAFLFDIDFSSSIYSYFRRKGRCVGDRANSITVDELYRFREYGNRQLASTVERLPGWIDYVIAYELNDDYEAADMECCG